MRDAATRRLYKLARWLRLREAQFAAEPTCRMCARRGIVTPATVCDHVRPHRGNVTLFWAGPFQSLCKRCHDSTKQAEEHRGHGIGCDAAGNPLDPGPFWR